jgi:hypothetical protein
MESSRSSQRSGLSFGLAAAVLFLCVSAPQARATEPDGAHVRIHPFLESGGFAGSETRLKHYEESRFRLHGEAGLDLGRESPGSAPGPLIGLGVTVTIGRDDGRLGLGPRVTWPINPRWALQATAGPAWSSKEEANGSTDLGWQLRTGLVYKRTASLSFLAQSFPYAEPFTGDTSKRLNSFYGGVMLHGRTGAATSVAIWGTLAAMMVAIIASGAAT